MKYPIYIPEITQKEREFILDCLDSTWISSRGKYIERFEQNIADYIDCNHAISVPNGTIALHLTLLAFEIGLGDEVIVPDFTYIATANAVLHANAKPVLVDVDSHTWNITVENIKEAITNKTKAIIVTDIYGTPPDMNAIMALAEKNNLIVIEDAAESLGATYRGKKAGNLAHAAILSFFGNKTITTGEGGMLLTNDHDLAKKALMIKNQGNSETKIYYHDLLGYNYRMTNLQAAIGVAQMQRIDFILERKRKIQQQYERYLQNHVKFQKVLKGITSSYWMVSMLVENHFQRESMMKSLENDDIETRPFFYPVHKMPYYDQKDHPVSNNLSRRGISVPSYPTLKEEDVKYISEKIIYYLTKM